MTENPTQLRYSDFASLRYSAGGQAITRRISQPIGAVLAWVAYRLGLSPNLITLTGTVVFASSALLFAMLPAGISSILVCVLMFQIGYGLDCADGQLARATGRTSAFGGWLDVACDHVRNVLLAGAICLWLAANGIPLSVTLAAAGLFLSGAAVSLHTATVLGRSETTAPLQTAGSASHARALITAVADTPSVLLVLACLRDAPPVLAVYLAAVGLLYLAMAIYLTSRRFRKQ